MKMVMVMVMMMSLEAPVLPPKCPHGVLFAENDIAASSARILETVFDSLVAETKKTTKKKQF